MKNNIKSLREEKGLTQKDCADKFDVTLRAWQTYEQGVSEPKYELLCKIADMFNVSLDYLLGRTEVREMNTLPIGALSEEEVKDIDAAIVTGYTQLSLETRRAFIAMLEELFGNIFEREDFGEEEPPQDSTA